MKWFRLSACALALATPARGQPMSRGDLLEQLQARDRVIEALQRRVEVLEARQSPPAAAPNPAPAPPPAAAPPDGGLSASRDEAALEALSRTLVQKGGLVLRPWRVEFVPSLAYSASQQQGLALVESPDGFPTVSDQRLRHDSISALATLRLGLPWESQVEVRAPYVWSRQDRALGNGEHAINDGSGLGDVELAVSHQLFHEAGWRPDVVGALFWRFDTGRDPFRTRVGAVATGSGTNEFGVRVTAVKSSEPMVFYSTLAYAHDLAVRESFGRVSLGDDIRWDLGAVLAVSPETSMTFGLSQDMRRKTEVDGVSLPGSDRLAASLQLGVQRVLTPDVLLDLSIGAGLTHDAPDYVFQISMPVRIW
jgi:hypothetical protein